MLPEDHTEDASSEKKKGTSRTRAFSARKMFEELERGPPLVMTGMVKESDKKAGVILFAPTQDCSRWLEIPEKLVVRYEALGQAICGDHRHHVVSLYLTRPETTEGEIFAMAQAKRPTPSALNAVLPPAGLGAGRLATMLETGAGANLAQAWDCYYDLNRGWIRKSDGTPC